MDAQAKLVRNYKHGREHAVLPRVSTTVLPSGQGSPADESLNVCQRCLSAGRALGMEMLAVVAILGWCSVSTAQSWETHPGYHAPAPPQQYLPPPPGAYAELVPDRRWETPAYETPLGAILKSYSEGAWIRLEYWHADYGHRSGTPMGTSILDLNGNRIRNTGQPFQLPFVDPLILLDPDNARDLTGNAVAPSTNGTNWNDVDGIKGGFGIPLTDRSAIEAGFWGLGRKGEVLNVPNIPPTSLEPVFGQDPVQFIVIPYTIDGQLGSMVGLQDSVAVTYPDGLPIPMIVYDADFFSMYTAHHWGAEVNHAYDLRIPHDGWKLQALIGWRHEEYSERLTFGGTFDNRSEFATDDLTILGPLAEPQSNRIDSKAHTFRHALQLGFRSELTTNRLTLGMEPKVAFGAGLIRNRVNTSNAREPGNLAALNGNPDLLIDDPESTTSFDRKIDFAPSAELNLYAKYDVTDWMRFRIGYNLIWMGRLGVADKSIRFNSISAADPTMMPDTLDFGVNQKVSNRYLTGFTVGGEIILP